MSNWRSNSHIGSPVARVAVVHDVHALQHQQQDVHKHVHILLLMLLYMHWEHDEYMYWSMINYIEAPHAVLRCS